MGQYYKIVNPVKRQYLNPHKFGAGLKLMEFTNTEYGPQLALCILLSNGNGPGGGDLGTDGLTVAEQALIGSWAGDPVIVAGDYGEPWKWVPDDLRGKTYTEREPLYRHSNGTVGLSSELPGGSYTATGKYKKVTYTFGKRKDRTTGEQVDHDENLYSAAQCFFEDISDKIIAVVAKGEGGWHPWAAMDLKDDGWRHPPEWGVLPEKEPVKPAGGKRIYAKYKANAKTPVLAFVDQVEYHVQRNPDAADTLLALLQEKVKTAKATALKQRAEMESRRR